MPGGTYFFTVNLLQRRNNDLLIRHIHQLRNAITQTRQHYPFIIHAWVVLPDHLHCVIQLPEHDHNFAVRWRCMKSLFSHGLTTGEYRTRSRQTRRERGIWQRRYWEHLIRDEHDLRAHMDYVHINPIKHGLVNEVHQWPYSTFHRWVARGVYPPDWGGEVLHLPDYED